MFRRRRWPRRNRRALLAGLAGLAGVILAQAPAAHAHEAQSEGAQSAEIALMGTIPIYWGENDGFGQLVAGSGDAHWARAAIEQHYRLHPLDYLSAEALAGHSRLLLAQPRGFSAEENVALDAWVRGGGTVLLFADPQMTGESRFALGDRRRPQDIALLSPILAHWGLHLRFDAAEDSESVVRDFAGVRVPVELAGHFVPAGEVRNCAIEAGGLVAQCRLGSGFALVVADAALLNLADPEPGSRAALDALLQFTFGDCAGNQIPQSHLSEKQEIIPSRHCGYDAVSAGDIPP